MGKIGNRMKQMICDTYDVYLEGSKKEQERFARKIIKLLGPKWHEGSSRSSDREVNVFRIALKEGRRARAKAIEIINFEAHGRFKCIYMTEADHMRQAEERPFD